MTQVYPIQWPEGWPRTPHQKRCAGRFQVWFAAARYDLLRELRLLGAKSVVISTMIPTRNDGLHYSGRSLKPGDDPGVAVYFDLNGEPKALACDAYTSPEANLRALGLSVGALRALGRHGVTGMLERAFRGFAALQGPDAIDWRRELQFGPLDGVDARTVKDRYRALSRRAHPDHGGSDQAMARLSEARDLALKEVGDRES